MPEVAGPVHLDVDIGTFGAKAVALDAGGRLLSRTARTHQPDRPGPGRWQHDAERIWRDGLMQTMRTLLRTGTFRAEQIASIGCSGIGPCVLPVDGDLKPLAPAILYGVDRRAQRQMAELTAALGPDGIRRRCGNLLTTQSAGPKICWLRDETPDVHRAAEMFLTCQSFLVTRLTGRPWIDHVTASYFHPLYDIGLRQWDVTGCENFVSTDQLPPIAWSGQTAGHITDEAAQLTGIPAGVPVAVGTVDAAAEALAAVATHPDDMMIIYGSSSFMIEVVDRQLAVDVLWVAPFLFPDSWQLAGGTATAGSMIRWAIDVLGLGTAAPAPFAEFVELAGRSVPGAHGVVALPYLSGERTPLHDPAVRGMTSGLDMSQTSADIAMAVLEGVAHSMAGAVQAFSDEGIPPRRALAVGGGVNNPLWLQAVSDSAGITQRGIDSVAAARSSAMLGALTAGAIPATALDEWTPKCTEVGPGPGARQRSADLRESFRVLTDVARALPHATEIATQQRTPAGIR